MVELEITTLTMLGKRDSSSSIYFLQVDLFKRPVSDLMHVCRTRCIVVQAPDE